MAIYGRCGFRPLFYGAGHLSSWTYIPARNLPEDTVRKYVSRDLSHETYTHRTGRTGHKGVTCD
jgi:hypothetical protein